MKRSKKGQIILNIVFILICALYILPMVLMVSISFTDENILRSGGYALIPHKVSLEAYKLAFSNTTQLVQSYKITAIASLTSTLLAIIIMGLLAYPLSRRDYALRKPITFLVFFTMLFNAGLVPNYIWITRYLHLNDSILVYILPGMVGAWNVIVLRTNYQSIPDSLIESAKLDGASELTIYFRIVAPLSMPALAAIGFLYLVPKWNDWMTAMLYIKRPELYSLQYLLQRILQEIEFLKSLAETGTVTMSSDMFPSESFKYAMAILAAGPIMLVFPFFQKYFAKGLTVGAVKG